MAELTLENPGLVQEPSSQKPKIRFQVRIEVPIPARGLHLWIDDKTEVVVFREKGRVRVFNSICPHMGAQLYHNRGKISCPWHELDYDTKTLCSSHHKFRRAKEYSAELQDGVLTIYRSGGQP